LVKQHQDQGSHSIKNYLKNNTILLKEMFIFKYTVINIMTCYEYM
jgi:hypothetical protein